MNVRKRSHIIFFATCLPLVTLAQIRTDASLGSVVQTLAGPSYVIPETLGKRAGNNLFHSFQTFNVNSGESAAFSTASAGIQNVISRVTGGAISRLDGPISLTAASGAPNFYFINPAGISFGAGASIDVPGAFHVSTANYLMFPDGNFYADTTTASTFSSAEPAAFGFLGANRTSIVVKDAVLYNAKGGLTLAAGDLDIDHATLATNAGDVRLVAGGVGALLAGLSGTLPSSSGRLEVINESQVWTAATAQSSGGKIGISAGQAGIRNGSQVGTFASASKPSGDISANMGSLEIDGKSAPGRTGISSQAAFEGLGPGGNVLISARGDIRISGGGMITADSFGAGNAGSVTVKAQSLRLDGAGHSAGARISSRSGAAGNAGVVVVDVTDAIELANASQISSDSFSAGQAGSISLRAGGDIRVLSDSLVASDAYLSGNAGSIDITAKNLTVDGTGGHLITKVSSQTNLGTGNAGTVNINVAGDAQMLRYARISSDTWSLGHGGNVTVKASNLLIDGMGINTLAGITSEVKESSSGQGGSVVVDVSGHLKITDSGHISTETYAQGSAGTVSVTAGQLTLDGKTSGPAQISSATYSGSTGNGGPVSVKVTGDAIILSSGILSSGRITSATAGSGNAGPVDIQVGGRLTVGGGGRIRSDTQGQGRGGDIAIQAEKVVLASESATDVAWILSDSQGSGAAGSINVHASKSIELAEGGFISSDSFDSGRAGIVTVNAPDILINGNGRRGGAAISSDARAAGNAGRIEVAAQQLSVIQGGRVSSETAGSGNAGQIEILVDGKLNISGGGLIRSNTKSSGHGGDINIRSVQVVLASENVEDFAWILSDSQGSGAAGSVNVQASKSIELAEGGFISSDSFDTGHGGTVSVNAPNIMIGGKGLRLGAAISSDAYAAGSAGRVDVAAQKLTIEGGPSTFPTGIVSHSLEGSLGNAGRVVANASDLLRVVNGGVITSSTAGAGRGGEVEVKAGTIEVIGAGSQIGAMALGTSGGQSGDVTVQAGVAMTLRDGGTLSIENNGNSSQLSTLTSSLLTAQASQLVLEGGAIKANSTGNVSAGSLQIGFSERLSLHQGSITTSANDGDGGAIRIQGGKLIDMKNSQITTSVLGRSGNGGDIHLDAKALVMNTGFIQANTAARNAAGGEVAINVQTLLTSSNSLFLGGQTSYDFLSEVFGFNVIQAAAPTGISGTVNITAPVLDISGSLSSLGGKVIDSGNLGRNPCHASDGSSLSFAGRGGVAPSARGWLGTQLAPQATSARRFGLGAGTSDRAAEVPTCSSR